MAAVVVAAVAVLLARVALAWLVHETDLALRRFAAHVVLATIDALENGPPLKVHQRDKHHGETENDGDVKRPLDHVLLLHFISEALVLKHKGCFAVGALLAWIWHAACNEPDLVRALELVVTGLLDDLFDGLGLRFPEVRVE